MKRLSQLQMGAGQGGYCPDVFVEIQCGAKGEITQDLWVMNRCNSSPFFLITKCQNINKKIARLTKHV